MGAGNPLRVSRGGRALGACRPDRTRRGPRLPRLRRTPGDARRSVFPACSASGTTHSRTSHRSCPSAPDPDPMAMQFNDPAVRSVGNPGGGAFMTAADLAHFYQALLHNPGGLWDRTILEDATTNVRCTFDDPLMGVPVNRTLGLVVAGDDGIHIFRYAIFGIRELTRVLRPRGRARTGRLGRPPDRHLVRLPQQRRHRRHDAGRHPRQPPGEHRRGPRRSKASARARAISADGDGGVAGGRRPRC